MNWAYDHVLAKPVAQRDVALWVNRLNSNLWTRGQVVVAFANDPAALGNAAIGGTDAASLPPAAGASLDVVQSLDYSWSPAGDLVKLHDTGAGVDQWQCFAYDNLHRLDVGFTAASSLCSGYAAVGPDPFLVDYGYSPIGNIMSATGLGTVGGSYVYGSSRPHAVTAAGANSYGYDASGNMTTRTTSAGSQTLVYDVMNRLSGITGAGADLGVLYDAEGDRVKRTLDGASTFYLGDSYETDGTASGGGGGSGVAVSDNFNRANTTSGLGSAWTVRSPYDGALETTARITSNQAVFDPSWTIAVSQTVTSGDAQYAEAVVDVDTSSNWVGPAVRLNANGTQGYGVLARGGVNELRLYRVNSGIATIIADGASAPVDGKTVRIEADGSTVNVFMDGVLEITWVDTSPFIGAQNRGVGILGLGRSRCR